MLMRIGWHNFVFEHEWAHAFGDTERESGQRSLIGKMPCKESSGLLTMATWGGVFRIRRFRWFIGAGTAGISRSG